MLKARIYPDLLIHDFKNFKHCMAKGNSNLDAGLCFCNGTSLNSSGANLTNNLNVESLVS